MTLGESIVTGTHNFKPKYTQRHSVPLMLTDKFLNTFQAIIVLVRNRLPDDATSLLRTFVEASVNAAFIFQKGDSAANQFSDFLSYRRWIEARDLNEVWPFPRGLHSTSEMEKMKDNHDRVAHQFRQHTNDWTDTKFMDRARFLDAHYGEQYRASLSEAVFRETFGKEFYIYRVLARLQWRQGSAFVHGTALSVSRHLQPKSPDVDLSIGRNPTANEAAWVLHMANMAMFQSLAFVIEVLGNGETFSGPWNGEFQFWLKGNQLIDQANAASPSA
jgi:hypothetical protein